MKKRLLSVFGALALIIQTAAGAAAEKKSDDTASYTELFTKDSVIDINIDIREEDLNDIYAYPKNEEYHSADITAAGILMKDSGIRTKGNFTLSSVARSDSDRYSYRIKFNKYVKGQTLLGLNELCLNNGYSDASYMREYLHYELLREMGVTVPLTVFCNLSINGEPYGLYLAVEALDDSFLERSYGEDQKGNLYKMEEGSSLVYREDENYSYAELKSGSDTERTGLKSLIKKLNDISDGEKGDIESVLDIDSALIYIAANTVLCNYDSYNSNMKHNYYMYENEDGVFSVIPWDLNMSFGGRESNTNVGIDTPVVSGTMEDSPLIDKLLSVDEYKEKYYGYIKEMMTWLEGLEDRVNEIKTVIKPYVESDASAFYTVEEFEKATSAKSDADEQTGENAQNQTERAGFGGGFGGFGRGNSIIDLMAKRLENLKAQFDGTAEKTTQTGNSGGFGGGFGGFGRNRDDADTSEGADERGGRNNRRMPGFGRGGKQPGSGECDGENGENRMPFGFGGEDGENRMPFDFGGEDGENRMPFDFDGEGGENRMPFDFGGEDGENRMPFDFGGEDGENRMPFDFGGKGGENRMPFGFGGEDGENRMPFDFGGEGGGNGMPFDFGGEDGENRMPFGFGRVNGENRFGNFGGKMPEGGRGFGFDSKSAGNAIRVHVDGHIVKFESDPISENDTTLAGFRAISEALGAEVTWDEASQTVTAVSDGTTVVLTVGSDTAYVNGNAVKLLAAPVLKDDSVMIPIRFISENLGMKVSWDEDAKLITINSK